MASSRVSAARNEATYREAFLSRFTALLAGLAADRPSGRCWKRSDLIQVMGEVREVLAGQGVSSALASKSLLDWLRGTGIVQDLSVEGIDLLLVTFAGGGSSPPDPLELLLAAAPKGVVCYFSALAYHALTTQPVAHHHVAVPAPPSPAPEVERFDAVRRESSGDDRSSRSPLGRMLFRHEGVPYYRTSRSVRLMPGVQERAHGPGRFVRITTREQTLLDTLSRPFHCGGPEVVFEAWHEARDGGNLDEDCLAQYVAGMGYPATLRRLGAMLKILRIEPGRALRRTLDKGRQDVPRAGVFGPIPLLPSMAYETLDEEWLVAIP